MPCCNNYIFLINYIWNLRNKSCLFALNFNARKSQIFPSWEILCNKNIFMKFIMRFHISKPLMYNVWTNWFKAYMTSVFKLRSCFNLTTINPWKLMVLVKYYIYLQHLWECCIFFMLWHFIDTSFDEILRTCIRSLALKKFLTLSLLLFSWHFRCFILRYF